jgi:IS5 family transposase
MGTNLWPDWLRKIDTMLEDDAVIEVVAHALEARWPQSRRRGRLGTPAEVVLKMLILKHLFDWSCDDREREVRANRVPGTRWRSRVAPRAARTATRLGPRKSAISICCGTSTCASNGQ